MPGPATSRRRGRECQSQRRGRGGKPESGVAPSRCPGGVATAAGAETAPGRRRSRRPASAGSGYRPPRRSAAELGSAAGGPEPRRRRRAPPDGRPNGGSRESTRGRADGSHPTAAPGAGRPVDDARDRRPSEAVPGTRSAGDRTNADRRVLRARRAAPADGGGFGPYGRPGEDGTDVRAGTSRRDPDRAVREVPHRCGSSASGAHRRRGDRQVPAGRPPRCRAGSAPAQGAGRRRVRGPPPRRPPRRVLLPAAPRRGRRLHARPRP